MKQKPTKEQLDALANFAANEGRNWKVVLRNAWETGSYPTGSDAATLQQIRNTFGPSWLVAFSVRPVGSRYTASDMGTAKAIIADMERPVCSICGETLRADAHTTEAAESGRPWHLFIYPDMDRHTGLI